MPYHKHLNKDKVLKQLIKKHGHYEISRKKNVYLQICAAIISQQLSTRVAEVIYGRFLKLFKTKTPKAVDIIAVPHETLRGIGLSNSKANYIKNVCNFFIEHKLTDAKLNKLNDDELFDLLTQIKGVGRWTVEMLLMFTFGREDIFSTGDLGLQKAMIDLYKIQYNHPKELVEKIVVIANSWSPYRTYACRYLWKHLDGPAQPPQGAI